MSLFFFLFAVCLLALTIIGIMSSDDRERDVIIKRLIADTNAGEIVWTPYLWFATTTWNGQLVTITTDSAPVLEIGKGSNKTTYHSCEAVRMLRSSVC